MKFHHLARTQAMNGFAQDRQPLYMVQTIQENSGVHILSISYYRGGLPIYEGKNGKRFSIR